MASLFVPIQRGSQGLRPPVLVVTADERPPILSLPGETLLEIFDFCRPFPVASGVSVRTSPWRSHEEAVNGQKAIINISHVCQLWRALVLPVTRLWSAPLFRWPDLAQTMLERAGSMPLTVYWPTVPHECDRAVGFAHYRYRTEPHRDRIAELDYTGTHKDVRDFLAYPQDMPPLARLSLTVDENHVRPLYLPTGWGHSPTLDRLTHLCLVNCLPGGGSILPASLTSLEIHLVWRNSIMSQSGMVRMLAGCPRLVSLVLHRAVGKTDGRVRFSYPVKPVDMADLSKLKDVELYGHAVDCLAFLRCLSRPDFANVTIGHIAAQDDLEGFLDAVFWYVQSRAFAQDARPLRELQFGSSAKGISDITMKWKATGVDEKTSSTCLCHPVPDLMELLVKAIGGMNLRRLMVFKWNDASNAPHDENTRRLRSSLATDASHAVILNHMKQLQALNLLSGADAHAFVQAVVKAQVTDWPRLRLLEVMVYAPEETKPWTLDQELFDSRLPTALRARSEAGYKLNKLVIWMHPAAQSDWGARGDASFWEERYEGIAVRISVQPA